MSTRAGAVPLSDLQFLKIYFNRKRLRSTTANLKFQSTRPMRGATGRYPQGGGDGAISIHAPHAGRDVVK